MKYTTDEALKVFFENLKRSDYHGHTETYNALHAYKVRWKAGNLGEAAAQRVLAYGGFEHVSYYKKKRYFNLQRFLDEQKKATDSENEQDKKD